MTYPVRVISADVLELAEIESGTARRVAAPSEQGKYATEEKQYNDRCSRLEGPIA